MGKKKANKQERYSIIISSLTDARKRSFVFSIKKRTLIFVVCAALTVMAASAGAAVLTASQAKSYSVMTDALQVQSGEQVTLINSYMRQLDYMQLRQIRFASAAYTEINDQDDTVFMTIGSNGSVPAQGSSGLINTVPGLRTGFSFSSLNGTKNGGIDINALKSISMTDAIEQVNATFAAGIKAQVEAIKAKGGFDEAEVIYNSDQDGDSNVENNWADVLAIYAVTTMGDEQKLMTITAENLWLLYNIYNEMNQLTFDTKFTPYKVEKVTKNGSESITTLKLTVYVTVNSLTYEEDAKLHDFDSKQKKKLEQLMSPDYYIYFADVLGLDVYDGMRSEELQTIISSLPANTKGSAIVKAALIRLGHPYSRGKRGSSNYVDCSYFAWWAYDQAGVSIPTSSVEQAKYCFNNGFVIEQKDIIPGDLVFWSKKSCDCGRWKEIHHAGIYIGGNKVIEASSSKGRVVIRKLWNGREWKLAFLARPYASEDKNAMFSIP